MFTTVILHGPLGKHVGRSAWKLAVDSVGEALRAIEAQTGTLFDYLKRNKGRGEYRVILNGRDHRDIDELKYSREKFETIEIVPVPTGSGGAGIFQIILGALLIVVGIILTVYGMGPVGIPMIMMGAGMLISGVSSLLFPAQNLNLNGGKEKKEANTVNNYLFNNAVNTTGQGEAVPMVYGEHETGSFIVCAQMTGSPLADDGIALGEHQASNPTTAYSSHAAWAILATRLGS